jgi:hypothetical protein
MMDDEYDGQDYRKVLNCRKRRWKIFKNKRRRWTNRCRN